MQMKWNVMALAIAAATSSSLALASTQSESRGFIEDSSLNVHSRLLYMNRDFRNGAGNTNAVTGKTNGYREETGLGVRAFYTSGFTQGSVGFGLDGHALSAIKLESGKGRYGTGQFGQTDDGSADDTQARAGAALKARISSTTLKHGQQLVETPVFSTDDARLLPEVATGTLLVSEEIDGLSLNAGRFTALSSMTATGRDTINGKGEAGLTSADIFGADYRFNEHFSAGLHASDVEDHFKKTYLNLNYTLPLGDERSLNLDFNAYRSKDDGRKLSGELDNKIWSLAGAYSMGAHTFTLAHQRASGDTGYTYGVDGGGTVWLANSVQYSDFIGKDERSWQVRYDLDMASFGVPGLSFMSRYITGDNIDTGTGRDAKEHEFNFESKYVVQEGVAKDLSLRLRSALYRASSAYDDDINEVRLIVEYPLSIL